MKAKLCKLYLISALWSLPYYMGYAQDNIKQVNTNIGGVGIMLQPTRPTVQIPNQFIRFYPGRRDYLDEKISFFPLSIISHRLGEIFFLMPYSGAFQNEPLSNWDKDLEVAQPYYYKVNLEDYKTELEFTPAKKAGFMRIHFPSKTEKHLKVKCFNEGSWEQISATEYKAVEKFNGMQVYMYGVFNVPSSFKENNVNWEASTDSTISFKYALSLISQDQAKKNLMTEIPAWDFAKTKNDALRSWEKVLNQIEVVGGTETQRKVFYSSLYRCYERMVDITEDNKYYSNYDGKIHDDKRDFYVDDWTWDTYLAHHPLRTILNPSAESDMVQSYVRMYEQSGWLPTFPVLWGDHACMNGFHSSITILDAYRKNIKGVDYEKAYEAMKKNALEATMVPWRNGHACSLDSFYAKNGYFPALNPGEKENVSMVHSFEKRQAVAVTLGHSYDDWAVAQLAKELGKTSDYEYFIKRSKNYRNLYWKEKGFFMPKDASGKWIDIDPLFDGGMGGRDYYDENNGWTYLWQVQHDVYGLMDLMGGKKNFENTLDRLFVENLPMSKFEFWAKFPDASALVGQFSMGNEPSFHIPYLYNFTDAPWKTQKKIRELLATWFSENIFGIPGDEDGGGMTAFVVFSSMGFYPFAPGMPIYTIGSPLFEKVTIHLQNGKDFKLIAENCSVKNKFIQAAYLNGKPLNTPWFSHTDIVNGGELKLVMGEFPNKTWGTQSATLYSTNEK